MPWTDRNVVYAVPIAQACADAGEFFKCRGDISRRHDQRKCVLKLQEPLETASALVCGTTEWTDVLVRSSWNEKHNRRKHGGKLEVNQDFRFLGQLVHFLNRQP